MPAVLTLVCLALALRVTVLFVEYVFGIRGTFRFHVETATFLFVVSGWVLRLTSASGAPERGAEHRSEESIQHQRSHTWAESWGEWLAFVAAALVLYWPALWIGFLSDDYVLIERAAHWSIGQVSPVLFRPIPLLLWGVILRLGGGAAAVHLLNVVAHGTNAFLVSKIVAGWVRDRTGSVIAGLLFLTSPLGPEAVAWASGVFDTSSTSLVLVLVLLARTYRQRTPLVHRAATIVTGVGALMCKETAAIAPALLLLDGWARARLLKSVVIDAVLLGVFIAIVFVQRVSWSGVSAVGVDWFVLQRGVFGSFGSLAVPWHSDVSREHPLVTITTALVLLTTVCLFFARTPSITRTRIVIAAAGWILIAVVPVWPILSVMPDLQGARYLYLAAGGWAALVAAFASPEIPGQPFRQIAGLVLVVSLVLTAAWGTRHHLRAWVDAAQLRDVVERSAPAETGCQSVILASLPDNLRGAYVFRNGVREGFQRDLGRVASAGAIDGTDSRGCSFRWDQGTLSFVR